MKLIETEYAELTMKIRGMLEERLSNVDGDPTTTGSETFRMEVDTSQGYFRELNGISGIL